VSIPDFNSLSAEDKARVETVEELTMGLLRMSSDMLSLHGEDNRTDVILMAAFAGAINEINRVSPNFSKGVTTLLSELKDFTIPRKYDA
jgi:hypothetical protein